MRGAIPWQAGQVFKCLNGIGESRHEDKISARAQGARGSHEIGQNTVIHSRNTRDHYFNVVVDFCRYQKDHFGIKDVENTSGEAIKQYMLDRIDSGKIGQYSTFKFEASALEKFNAGLNRYAEKHETGHSYRLSEDIKEARVYARDTMDSPETDSRAYADAKGVIASIENQDNHLGAKVQHEAGFRIHEVSLIHEEQRKGIRQETVTGEERGVIEVQGKGGKVYEGMVSQETYRELENHIKDNGEFAIDKADYGRDLRAAALEHGEDYHGSHDLRHTHAQERFHEIQENGYSREDARQIVSRELGHERPDITERYLL